MAYERTVEAVKNVLSNSYKDGAVKIAIKNIKGGVAKSVTTATFGRLLAYYGFKVLVIDSDPQGTLTSSYGANVNSDKYSDEKYNASEINENEYNIGDVIFGYCDIREAIVNLPDLELDLIKGDLTLIKHTDLIDTVKYYSKDKILNYFSEIGISLNQEDEEKLISQEYRNMIQEVLEPVEKDYDFILFDMSPYYSSLNENVLCISDFVIVPAIMDKSSQEGYNFLIEKLDEVKDINPNIDILGILPTLYRSSTNLHKLYLESLEEEVEEYIFEPIPMNTKVSEANSYEKTIFDISKGNKAARAYEKNTRLLVNNIMKFNNSEVRFPI